MELFHFIPLRANQLGKIDRSLVLCGESRQEMEDWLNSLRAMGENRPQTDSGVTEMLSGNHHWYATSHARPTYCNVCRDALYGKYMLSYV